MGGYETFAQVYDELTREIDYPARAAYFDNLILKHGGFRGILLDLGCGTGSLSEALAGLGYDVIGVDNSEEMLLEAMDKKLESGADITYLCQDMTELDLYGTVDAVVSALDSLNHLTDYEDFCKAISRAALFLHPDGVMAFDVNTPYKHREILGDNIFIYDFDDVYCVWQNHFEEPLTVEMELDLFIEEEDGLYRRSEEAFAERAYTHEEILKALAMAGMELCAVYGEDSLEPPGPDAQRLIYVARHMRGKDAFNIQRMPEER